MRIPPTTERAYTAAAGCLHSTNTSETEPFNAARFSTLVNLCGTQRGPAALPAEVQSFITRPAGRSSSNEHPASLHRERVQDGAAVEGVQDTSRRGSKLSCHLA